MLTMEQQWKEKYPNAKIIITYNTERQEELLIINNPPISKAQQKREKQNAKAIALQLLNNVNLPNQLTFKPTSSKQRIKEEKMQNFMNLNYLNYVRCGRQHYNRGLSNVPRSRSNIQDTEFACQKDKKPKNFEVWRNKAKVINEVPVDKDHHRRLKYPPSMRKSPMSNTKHISLIEAEKIQLERCAQIEKKTIEVVDLRLAGNIEKGMQHELK